MIHDGMNKNFEIYKKGVQNNLQDIEYILDDPGLDKGASLKEYKELFKNSSEFLLSKWRTRAKYCRTESVQSAFKNKYPEKHLELSLMLDAMVNILDELYDEPLDEQQKNLYVLEFLRTVANYNHLLPSKKFAQLVRVYFDELITLAVAEKTYQERIEQEQDPELVIKYSAQLLVCRGMDIDIFVDIPLLGVRSKKYKENVKQTARLFRAFNILKKDIDDMEHDKENNIDTALLLIEDKDISFRDYLEGVSKELDPERSWGFKVSQTSSSHTAITNFLNMIEKEKARIKDHQNR